MTSWATQGTARIVAGDYDKFFIPYGWKYDGTKRAVIWLHGSGGNYKVGPVEKLLMDQLNTVWVCSDLGGLNTWMNDTVLARVTNAWDYAKTLLGAKTDKIILWGGSMGGGNALQYALTNPNNVAAVGATIPALDPEYVRAQNINGLQATIQAIYGATVPSNRQPKLNGSLWNAIVSGHIWYSTSDPYTPQASTEQFIANSGVEATNLGAVGHSYLTTPIAEARDFLLPHL